MLDLLSVNNVAITLLDYPLSWVELVGTILYLWSVWLVARRQILTWPVGIVSVMLYLALFYQIRLYSDAAEQIYYLGASVYGWWIWSHGRRGDEEVAVRFTPPRLMLFILVVTFVLSAALAVLVSNIHILLPDLFPAPAAFPVLDALTTMMSFTAMWLMARRRIESWIYWIVVDVIGIGLYYAQGVRFLSLLYVILLVMAILGLRSWLMSSTVGSGSGGATTIAELPDHLPATVD